MKYYSGIKKSETLPFVTTWMDLEDIMLGEINQWQIMHDFTYMKSKTQNKWSNITKQKL